MAFVEVLS